MDFTLSDQQRHWQQTAREFAQKEVAPYAGEWDADRVFPLYLVPMMAERGFLGGRVGMELGGSSLDHLSLALVYEELGKACSSVRGFMAVHTGLVTHCIADFGTAEQKQRWLPALTKGETIGCYCLTEPNAGSDAASLETTATRDGDDYILDGEKIWITNGNIAGVGIVFATLDRGLRHKGVCAFLVEMDAAGIHRSPMSGEELGHRAADHATIRFEGCRVPASALLGESGSGFRVAMGALDHGRLGVAAGALGVAEACLDACLDFARNRQQFGKAISEFQMIQDELARMAVEVEASRWLVYAAASKKDRGEASTLETSVAKLYATEAAMRVASRAVLLHGGRGYSNEYPVERYFRDIKGYEIYEGTSHIQKLIIARELLKRPVRPCG